MSLSLNYPVGRPTLNLDFAGSGVLDPRVSFTRTTAATYFDVNGVLRQANANTPRFDYNPATLAAQGLLIEESRTNLLTYSEAFDTLAGWTPTDASISADATTSPSGTTTADKFIEGSGTGVHAITQGTVTSGVTYTFSVFAKAAERNQIQLSGMGTEGQGFFTNYNLSTGVVTGSTTGSAMIPVGNGWYRCTLPITASATGGPIIRIRDASGNNTYTGDGTSGVYIWGAQLEAGAFPTSYIPTTTTALTRAADVATINTLSPWYNAAEGTLYGEYSVYTSAGAKAIAQISDGTFSNRIQFFTNTGDPYSVASRLVSGGITTNPSNTGSVAVGTVGKVALAYAIGANQGGISVNGSAVNTSSPASAFNSVTALELGKGASISQLNGWLRRVSFYPRRLSNAELQAITA